MTNHENIAGLSFLNEIDEVLWERVCGDQSREEFAKLANDDGQNIEDAWAEALTHSDSL